MFKVIFVEHPAFNYNRAAPSLGVRPEGRKKNRE